MRAFFASTLQQTQQDTLIRSLDANFNMYQRVNTPFVVNNTSNGYGDFTWHVLDITDPDSAQWGIYETSTTRHPEFTLPRGEYLIYGEVQGLNPTKVARIFWHKKVTVLPVLKTELECDWVYSLTTGANTIDGSGWEDGDTVFFKKSGATVGRIRINNAPGAHVIIDPSSEMEVNAFAGSSGLTLVNCQNLIIDAVGTTDAYGLYINGVGDNTAHGIVINTVSDIRCEGIEIYGVKIEVPQTGASGLRMLGDESADYNASLPPLTRFRFGRIWIVESGHEGEYLGVSVEGGGSFGGPRKFDDVRCWDFIVDESSRDAQQFGGVLRGMFHNWTINASGTLGESSHNSYIVHNEGNQNCKVFNIRCKGGVTGISMQFGATGANPMMWNIVMEVPTGGTFSSWNFIQVGNAPNTDITIMNLTFVALSGDEIVFRFDSTLGQGTQDIDDFTLINILAIKGATQNFFTKDGTNSEGNWDRDSGNQIFTPATAANALLDPVTHLPASVLSPAINGGVTWTFRRTLAEMLGKFGSLEIQYDVDGYVVGLDGQYPTGAGSGMELKLAAL